MNLSVETDKCAKNPCKPPAVCEVRDEMFYCSCPEGFENKDITECQGFSYILLLLLNI